MAKKVKKINTFKGSTPVEEFADLQSAQVVVLRKEHFRTPREGVAKSGKLGKVKVVSKATCNGKIRYRDRREALQVLHKIEVTRSYQLYDGIESHRRESRVYACSDCKGAHLTSQPGHSLPWLRLIQGTAGDVVTTWELTNVA
jgi:hypothetical protein